MEKAAHRKFNVTWGTRAADVVIYALVAFAAMVTVYPFIYVFSMSISAPIEVLSLSVWLLPKGFSLAAYEQIVKNSYLWRSLLNSVYYTLTGTTLTIIFTVMGAYPIRKKRLVFRKFFIFYIIIPMYFVGGIIPKFILISKIGFYNTPWAIIVPPVVNIFYIILTRTYFSTIPEALEESALIDGANEFTILFRIIVPLSKPIIAVIALYSAVQMWNQYFQAMMFLRDAELHPLQLFLAKVLVFGSSQLEETISEDETVRSMATAMQLKYAVIVFTSFPIICVYPFLQKYFVKGALIGSLKE